MSIETVSELLEFIFSKLRDGVKIEFTTKFWSTFSKKVEKEVKDDRQNSGMVSQKEDSINADESVDQS